MRARARAAGLSLACLVCALFAFPPRPLEDLDRQAQDLLTGWVGGGAASGRVVVVDIDERSLARHGRWPWPRGVVACLVERMREAGTRSIVLDMLFADAEPAPPGTAASADEALEAALRLGHVSLGYYFVFEAGATPTETGSLKRLPIQVIERGTRGSALFEAHGVIENLPLLSRAAEFNGFLNASPDSDGRFRRLPLLLAYRGGVYPALPLAALLAERHPRTERLEVSRGGAATLWLDQQRYDLEPGCSLRLRFRNRGHGVASVSAADVLSGAAARSALAGRIAVVGGSAAGMQAGFTSPDGVLLSGVEAEATAIDNLLAGDFFRRPPAARLGELGLALLLGCAAALVLSNGRSVWSALAVVAVALAAWPAAAWLLASAHVLASPLPLSAALGAELFLMPLLNFLIEQRRADQAHRQLASAEEFTLSALACLTEIRDYETGSHLMRVRHYMRPLCQRLAGHPRFRHFLSRDVIDLLAMLAPIHDIGKVGVPDRILLKPGRLDAGEVECVRRHVEYGRDVLEQASAMSKAVDGPMLRLARQIVFSHHERWDGTGYPKGLAGEAIPIAGRLMAVIDVYDALVSRRVYKEGYDFETAERMISDGSGTQFDPAIVEAFLEERLSLRSVAEQFPDR